MNEYNNIPELVFTDFDNIHLYIQQNKEKLNDYNKARYRAIKELIGDQKIEINLSKPNQTQK